MTNITILHSADWHIDIKRRFIDHVEALTRMIMVGIERHVDAFVFAGDFAGLDAPHHLKTKEILSLIDLFTLASRAAPTIVIPGNHDESEQFKIFSKLNLGENFYLSLEPNIRYIPTQYGLLNVHTVPWMGRQSIYQRMGKSVESIDNEETSELLYKICQNMSSPKNTILVSHFAAPEALMGKVEVKSQFDTVLDIPRLNRQFAGILLGHLHRRQSVRANQEPRRAWYSGSPVPIDFSETEPKGCNIITLTDAEPLSEFIKIPSWKMESINVADADNIQFRDSYEGSYIRINIEVPPERRLVKRQKFFKDLEKAVMNRGALGVKINKLPSQKRELGDTPKFIEQKRLDDQIDSVMEDRGYDRKTRERIVDAYRRIRERQLTENF